MHGLTPVGVWLLCFVVALSGVFAGRTRAEIPPIDAVPVAQFETATFSLG